MLDNRPLDVERRKQGEAESCGLTPDQICALIGLQAAGHAAVLPPHTRAGILTQVRAIVNQLAHGRTGGALQRMRAVLDSLDQWSVRVLSAAEAEELRYVLGHGNAPCGGSK